MKRLYFSVLIICLSFISCGDNGKRAFENAYIVQSGNTNINQEITMKLEFIEWDISNFANITWSIIREPIGSNLDTSISLDTKSMTVIPRVIGRYEFSIHNGSGDEKLTNFTVYETFPYDEGQIELYDKSKGLDDGSGVIKNQYWVYSLTGTEEDIRKVVSKYPDLMVLGWDRIQGVLIEIDIDNPHVYDTLEKIQLESGITSVDQRTYSGERFSPLFE